MHLAAEDYEQLCRKGWSLNLERRISKPFASAPLIDAFRHTLQPSVTRRPTAASIRSALAGKPLRANAPPTAPPQRLPLADITPQDRSRKDKNRPVNPTKPSLGAQVTDKRTATIGNQ